MQLAKSSLYGRTRRMAYTLWRGPDYAASKDDTLYDGGGIVIYTALRMGDSVSPIIESRAVYVNLHDSTITHALVRGMQWDSQSFYTTTKDITQPLLFPVKHVQVPVAFVHQWLEIFRNCPTAIHIDHSNNDQLPIYTLRCEISTVYCSFVQTWQGSDNDTSILTCLWRDMWNTLGDVLLANESLLQVDESFPKNVPEESYSYDQSNYVPRQYPLH